MDRSSNRVAANEEKKGTERTAGHERKQQNKGKRIRHNKNGQRPKTHILNSTSGDSKSVATDLTSGSSNFQIINKESSEESSNDPETCIICASEIIHEGLGPCNHRTCHVCCIRMRVLFKDETCTLCRTPAPYVIITDDRNRRFEDFSDENFKSIENNIGLRFDNLNIRDDVLWMLGYNCPEKECDVVCLAWPHLHDHTRRAHNKKICDLCSKHRKIFPHEHDLFTDAGLSKHMKKGDEAPGRVNQSGFKGHPLCNFCGNRFYGDDELFTHLREKHERCFVCDRAKPNSPPSYYPNYEALSSHFVKDHFVCQMKDCLDQKYIAFVSEFELKAHMLEVHGDYLSKDDRRDARNVDLSDFSYRESYHQQLRGAGTQRGQRNSRPRGLGRDPNAAPIPNSSAQPLRRDELAFQRQMSILSDQSRTTRSFGHQLTDVQGRTPASVPQQSQATTTVSSSSIANFLATGDTLPTLDLTQASLSQHEKNRAMRHKSVIERASLLLQMDDSKVTLFRKLISKFKGSKSSARALVDELLALFDEIPSNSLGTLIREVADLFEDSAKSDELRTAWNDWRAINEDYPSLPAVSEGSTLLSWASKNCNTSSGPVTVSSSNRAMKLKKSTAKSVQSPTSQNRSWGSASLASSTTVDVSSASRNTVTSAFPSLPHTANRINVINISNSNPPKTGESASISATTYKSPSKANQNSTTSSSRPISNGGNSAQLGVDAFPALPRAVKLQGINRNHASALGRRDMRHTSDNVWNGAGATGSSSSGRDGATDDGHEDSIKGKKKMNKGKKQVLMGWG
ncbi:BgTH12-07971 [Blumeria graminis f. sp. triticale]|uniref:RING-type E3 ubiquitin transferase n=3 Tax=Blumeria graminis TaxID=34373 RepID=A0A061HLW1_BLUGR|nr:hypothetical protein BGT96224_3128 [Blumeria graminis f. sp. tritici 96224]CAD6504868.1 BgTH12-07971 [Blumeria graminis f. sp. triticale]VDB92889.1 Bgt-3128 [Blumeria graminis f. sp. tritici]